MSKSYWNSNGTYQMAADKLNALIPACGPVEQPRGANKKLERFRKASNVYYDIFNNGGINRGGQLKTYFGIVLSDFKRIKFGRHGSYRTVDFERIQPIMDKAMDQIVLEAAAEQFAK